MEKVEMLIPNHLAHTVEDAAMGLAIQGFFVERIGTHIIVKTVEGGPQLETQFSSVDIAEIEKVGITVKVS